VFASVVGSALNKGRTSPTITSVGQIIGVCVGTTLKAAQAGALAVVVEYEEVG
jgi:hypothetical protein